MEFPDAGFKTVIDQLVAERDATKPTPMLGHTFQGYRVWGFDGFVAIFKFPANPAEQLTDKHTCEQIVKNAKPGTESHEGARLALQYWPQSA